MADDVILASQYSNIQLSRGEIKAVPTMEGARIVGGYLTLDLSVATGTMWIDMDNVEVVVQVYSMGDKLIRTRTFALSIEHGQVNRHVLQVLGVGAGTYKVSATLYYAGQAIGQTFETVTAASHIAEDAVNEILFTLSKNHMGISLTLRCAS
ncbi:MAG: hypothetical protein ACP5QI_02120 [Candidatus Bathyarchaeia archaeon]